jgi:hypothetical protein
MNLTELIACINNQLQPIFEKFTGAQLYDGIAENVKRGADNMPGYVDKNGNANYVGAADTSPLILYHKSNGLQISTRPSSFGDSLGFQVNTYSNTMYIFFDKKKLGGVQADELVNYIQANLQNVIAMPNYRSVIVRLLSANFNSAQIYAAEYQGVQNEMRLQQNIFSITYQIEAVFDPVCLPKCL